MGSLLVTIGPGATNAITGVAGAYTDSSPMFVLSGQANSRILKYQMETGIRTKGTQSITLDHVVGGVTKYFASAAIAATCSCWQHTAFSFSFLCRESVSHIAELPETI